MGVSGGRRRAEPARRGHSPFLVLAALFGGAALGAAAWFVLVEAAISFGSEARDGQEAAWLFMVLATLGAIACLLLVLVLVARGLALLGIATPRARTSGGGHRRR